MEEINYDLIKAIPSNLGQPVTGEGFFGREDELNELEVKLKRKSSIIIPGPRRWGKTSFIEEFMRTHSDKMQFINLQIQGQNSIKQFNDTITDKLISNNIISADKFQKVTSDYFHNLEIVLRNYFPKEFIIVVDEISDFVLNIKANEGNQNAIRFLRWLRYLRQILRIQMILTGSINITSAIKYLKAEDSIGDMELMKLNRLSQQESTILFLSLLKNYNISVTDDALRFCNYKISDGIHFYIQLFADVVREKCKNNYTIDSIKEITKIYIDLINTHHPTLSYQKTRLDEIKLFQGQDIICARRILSALSDDQKNFDYLFALIQELVEQSYEKKQLYDLLSRLCDEGYLLEDNGNYRFLSVILKDYWQKYPYQ